MDKDAYLRQDVLDKVTGAARYGADYHSPGMYYLKILWPCQVSARVDKIDFTLAENAPGIIKIITRSDITGPNLHGMLGTYDHPVLIGEGEYVRYAADALAIVAAQTEDEAERALDLIQVDYSPLPAAHTVAQAKEMGIEPCFTKLIKQGDAEKGFEQAAVTEECEYDIIACEHAYLEPEGGYACIDEHDIIHLYCGSQDIISNQKAACYALGLPQNKLRMTSPYVGGGFGGKHSISVQIYLVLAAQVLHHAVSLTWTREESIQFSCKKQQTHTRLKLGLDKDGHICALEGLAECPNAPYMGNGRDNFNGAVAAIIGPYRYKNVKISGNMYPTTFPEQGAFRSVGACDGVFMFETLLTRAGAKLGLDQLEVRRRNWLMRNDEIKDLPSNSFMRNFSNEWLIQDVTAKALEAAGPLKTPSGTHSTGRGLACAKPSFCAGNTDYHAGSTAEIHMYLDGSVTVKSGFSELGQGITAVIRHYAADGLGIAPEKVDVMLGDSHNTPSAGALGFSQATVNIGNAVLIAAEKLKHKLESLAEKCLGETGVRYTGNGFFYADGSKALDWQDFSRFAFAQVAYLSAAGRWRGNEDNNNIYGITPIACVVDVELDKETGQFRVLQLIHCHDTGKVIHYQGARGQVLGAAVMGYGISAMEEIRIENGICKTPSFAEYLIPTAMDVPDKNEAIMLEGNIAHGCPQGAKAIGEHGIYCVGAAIANALFDAAGIKLCQLPITPEKVLRALGKI